MAAAAIWMISQDVPLSVAGGVVVAVAAIVRTLDRRITFSFGAGFVGYRSEMDWPQGVQEDDDVRWRWRPTESTGTPTSLPEPGACRTTSNRARRLDQGRARMRGGRDTSLRAFPVEPNATDANPDGAHDVGSIPSVRPVMRRDEDEAIAGFIPGNVTDAHRASARQVEMRFGGLAELA